MFTRKSTGAICLGGGPYVNDHSGIVLAEGNKLCVYEEGGWKDGGRGKERERERASLSE